MMQTYKALGWLLSHPEPELIAALPEIRATLAAEGLLGPERHKSVERLIRDLARTDLLSAQERYGALFDRVRSLALYLFEHVHGDSRARGQAMVDLLELYGRQGLEAPAGELPDYLPMFLEYLSLLPAAEARTSLADTGHILAALHQRLAGRGSLYAGVFAALLDLAGCEAAAAAPAEAEDESFEALDRAWEEEAVTFGPTAAPATDQASCSRAAAMLSRMNGA